MHTGGAGSSRSWATQADAEAAGEWSLRAKKHCWSSSRRGAQTTFPFPLQDHKGRCKAAQQFYQSAGELTPAHHNVAAQGLVQLYPGMELGKAKSLNNQILCMISEYHLICFSQGSTSTSPVLPEAAEDLLPPMDEYLVGGNFEGARDLRVKERANTLRVTICLHCLDMAANEDRPASLSLDVT